MYDDAEARQTVRELVKTLEAISDRSGALAFVVARKNPNEYERLLESAGRAEEFILKPMMELDPDLKNVYAALDNPASNWCEAIKVMLKSTVQTWSGDKALAHMEFMNGLYARFEEEERRAQEGYKGDPGFAT
jgi:hypothetical protein